MDSKKDSQKTPTDQPLSHRQTVAREDMEEGSVDEESSDFGPQSRSSTRNVAEGSGSAGPDEPCESRPTQVSSSHVQTYSLAPDGVSRDFEAQYRLGARLGTGGMGAVYRARDRALHRVVAVKVMHNDVAASETMVRRFYKEAQIAAQLEHPGIVPTYNIRLSAGGEPRLAMRLIRGQDLSSFLLKEYKRLGPREGALTDLSDRLELFVRACDAVQFAHDKGVVHRDLKPENIMIGPHRDSYVMDWGLATLQDEPDNKPEDSLDSVEVVDDPRATRVGELMGTVAYMAPEQAIGDHDKVGPAADQFAMGLTLQEVVTLKYARKAPNLTSAITQAVLCEKRKCPPWVPAGLQAIVAKATAKNISDRYQSMDALSDDVRRFMRDEELSAAPDPWQKMIWRKLSDHKTSVLFALLVLVAVVLSLGIHQVVTELHRERESIRQAAYIAEQVNVVSARAQAINSRARGVEMELAHLAGATKHALTLPGAPHSVALRPSDLTTKRAPKDTAFSERYRQLISFQRAVLARAPGADPEQATEDEDRLAQIEDDFKEAYQSAGFVTGAPRSADSAPLQWTYVATPAGVLLNYPGAAGLEADYDPRTRPWFKKTIGTKGPVWGDVYGDASGSGTLLACDRAVYDTSGKLLAIVGADFLLNDIRAALPLPSVPGYKQAWLLNQDGRVVAEALVKGSSDSFTDHDARHLPKFKHKQLLDEMSKHPAAGQIVVERTRYIYAALTAIGGAYVVSLSVLDE